MSQSRGDIASRVSAGVSAAVKTSKQAIDKAVPAARAAYKKAAPVAVSAYDKAVPAARAAYKKAVPHVKTTAAAAGAGAAAGLAATQRTVRKYPVASSVIGGTLALSALSAYVIRRAKAKKAADLADFDTPWDDTVSEDEAAEALTGK